MDPSKFPFDFSKLPFDPTKLDWFQFNPQTFGLDQLSALTGINVKPVIAGFVAVMLWELIWKGVAMWRSARNGQSIWFVCLFLINTLGLLPILYLVFCKKNKNKNG